MVSCGSDKRMSRKVIKNGEKKTEYFYFQQYGIFDANELKHPDVKYEVVIGNVVWGVLLFSTVIVPVLVFGWYLYEPVEWKDPSVIYYEKSK